MEIDSDTLNCSLAISDSIIRENEATSSGGGGINYRSSSYSLGANVNISNNKALFAYDTFGFPTQFKFYYNNTCLADSQGNYWPININNNSKLILVNQSFLYISDIAPTT